jgi:glucose-1-phosphate thymidylyltransferase
MQAVILAGGKGTRMGHLTVDRPKPMIEILGRNLIEHKIDRMPQEITEVIIIVHYMKEKIMEYFGDSYKGKKITYVDQGDPHGTAHAVWKARDVITGDFITMMGDDVYSSDAIVQVVQNDWAMTVTPHQSFKTAGDVKVSEQGNVIDVVFDDAGTNNSTILIDTCLYKLKKDIFNIDPVQVSGGKEFGLPHTVFKYVKENNIPMKVLKTDTWIKLNTPEDVHEAESLLQNF